MHRNLTRLDRRRVLAGAGIGSLVLSVPGPALAQLSGGSGGLPSILGKATDSALDKLAQPGAFYDDENVRIKLPIIGSLGGRRRGLLGALGGAVDRTGLLSGLTRTINDAAGEAAGEAKPIFRDAIDDLSFSDAPGIIRNADGGTQYLRRSSNDTLHSKLEPLVDSALERLGFYSTFDQLAGDNEFIRQAGLNRQSINKSVTDQGLDGIFTYIGNEERAFRKDPLKGLGNVFGDLLGN